MRKLSGVAAIAALAFGATVVMAASPAPSASPSAKPSASPSAKPSASPSPSPSSSKTSTAAPTTTGWTATVQPVEITGSVTVHQLKSGGGTVTFKLSDILNGTDWSIRLDRGTLEGSGDRTLIAARSGDQVQHFLRDTISIHLTKTEMRDFLNARKSTEVVAFISDGTRLSVARFPKM